MTNKNFLLFCYCWVELG